MLSRRSLDEDENRCLEVASQDSGVDHVVEIEAK